MAGRANGHAASALRPAPVPRRRPASGERRIPLSGFRKAVAATLSRSRVGDPRGDGVGRRRRHRAVGPAREQPRPRPTPGPGLLACIARFVVAGLQQYPELNSRLDTERQEIVELDAINLGLAAQTERGLVVPAVLGRRTR